MIPPYLRSLYQFERDYGPDKKWVARSKTNVVAYGRTPEEALQRLAEDMRREDTKSP